MCLFANSGMESKTLNFSATSTCDAGGLLYCEIDGIDALGAADRLQSRAGFAFLDSAARHPELCRYSYIAVDPFGLFEVRQGKANWCSAPVDVPPLQALRNLMQRYRGKSIAGLPPFQSGCIGYVAYDFAHHLEGGALEGRIPTDPDEMVFSFYDVVLAFDHLEKRCWLMSSGWPEPDPERRMVRAAERLEMVAGWLRKAAEQSQEDQTVPALQWNSNFTRKSCMDAVKRVKDYVLAGDIYQANISQCFTASLPRTFCPWSFYRRLRQENPAPFSAYLACGDLTITSSSPERFLKLVGNRVETRPIKGTAARSADVARDKALATSLLNSEKDRAENIMVVDLLRNDLSKVCKPGSVDVPSLCGLESFASVHHLVSVVTGELRDGFDGIDLIAACFPSGSVTGVPKIRAMEIIGEIERQPRQAYCGAIGYLGFDGNLDLNVAIRTVTLRGGEATFQAGGGVTLMSEPQAEYNETLVKAEKLFRAFAPLDRAAPDPASITSVDA